MARSRAELVYKDPNIVFAKDNEELLLEVSTAAFKHYLTGGVEDKINESQSRWQPLSRKYLRRKNKLGLSSRKWVRTGRTLKAFKSGKPKPRMTSTTGDMKFKFNPSTLEAYIEPNTLGKNNRGSNFYVLQSQRPIKLFQDSEVSIIEKDIEEAMQKLIDKQDTR